MSTYNIETVLKGIGYIRNAERRAIRSILGNGADIIHNEVGHELHLSWNIDADTIEEATTAAHAMRKDASRATGVYGPRTTFFSAREIDEN